jgi:transcriptional regulator with XRE-family HTH domain
MTDPRSDQDPALAIALRTLREGRGINREALAMRADISIGLIARIELARATPTSGTLRRVAVALGVSISQLAYAIEKVARRVQPTGRHGLYKGAAGLDMTASAQWDERRAAVVSTSHLTSGGCGSRVISSGMAAHTASSSSFDVSWPEPIASATPANDCRRSLGACPPSGLTTWWSSPGAGSAAADALIPVPGEAPLTVQACGGDR